MLCKTIADLSNLTSFSILKTELSYIHLTIILLPKTSKVIGANFLAAHKKSEKKYHHDPHTLIRVFEKNMG